ncbi:MAG: polyprenyl synthetase family protein [Chloroflexi bacterium]|nr:polyprenyl synthetase family protein [Chloroflexota bacterium]
MTQAGPGLRAMIEYHMGWIDPQGRPMTNSSGKALRPALCLFACTAVGGTAEEALPAAAALELIHNFSLIHDDIQDGDRERRHRPTLWALWGQPQALEAGNTMRVLADLTLLTLHARLAPVSRMVKASGVLTGYYLEMIEGQYLDLSYEKSATITLQGYMEMVSRKTGALMEAAMYLGAFVGTQDEEQIRALALCGRFLGLGFQIRDDVLGIWGDTATTGKATGADLYRKKKSFPVVYVMERGSPVQKRRVADLYAREKLSASDVEELTSILEQRGAREFAQRIAEEQCAQALTHAHQARLSASTRQELEELVDFLTTRQS